MTTLDTQQRYLICIANDGYEASLELRKVYVAAADVDATTRGFVRIIDESGEDYLYPEGFFVPVELSQEAQRAFAHPS